MKQYCFMITGNHFELRSRANVLRTNELMFLITFSFVSYPNRYRMAPCHTLWT